MPSQSGKVSNWTVLSGGPYKVKITSKGAKGGNSGAPGATTIGEFIVISGQQIDAIAGAPGGDGYSGGGGGGTGARLISGGDLIIAGGGGGYALYSFLPQGGQILMGDGNGGSGNK